MKQALLIAAPLALAACVNALPGAPFPPPPPPPVVWGNATATVGFGGQAVLNQITIRPLAVVEDSRCPVNVQCVWAGRLTVATEIAERGGQVRRVNMVLREPVPVAGGRLTLIAAHPPKFAGAQPSPPASQFTFELTR